MMMHQEIINKDEEIGKLRSSLKKGSEEASRLREEVDMLKKAQVIDSLTINYLYLSLRLVERYGNMWLPSPVLNFSGDNVILRENFWRSSDFYKL